MNIDTIQFEGVKTALKQTKDGYSLTLAVHPDDLPQDLMRDFVGARYMVVMVRMDEHEQPMDREKQYPGDTAVKIAGMLCRDAEFWQWLHEKEWLFEKNEQACIEALSGILGIESRKELKTNEQARTALDNVKKSFDAWRNSK
jgi:hypothetical protein